MMYQTGCFFLLSFLLFPGTLLYAAECSSDFTSEILTDNGYSLPFRIYVPDQHEKENLPLLIFLHGSGERGTDNEKQLCNGICDVLKFCKNGHPAVIAVPQCPPDIRWVNVDWSADTHEMPVEPSWPLKMVRKLIDETCDKYNIDRSRIYITGLSMGGYGTWDLLQRYPSLFAGGVAVCGGGDVKQAVHITKTPIWALHGDADTVVKPLRSRMMVDAVREAGGNIRYTEYQGVGHGAWVPAYSSEEVLLWLFSQKKQI